MQATASNGGSVLGQNWVERALDAEAERRGAVEPDVTELLGAKLISAAVIAKLLDSPCPRCARRQREGLPRLSCQALGCDRWSTRRARRWLRRSQCPPSAPDAPQCRARSGGSCACQVGFRLAAQGQWCTTITRLRDRFPDLCDLLLLAREED